jgi:hypothetical protein
MEEYLIYCPSCNEYSRLGKFLKKKQRFQGEYSLLYNCYLDSESLLSCFLLKHRDHLIKMIESKTDQYLHIIKNAQHYRSKEIDHFAEEWLHQKKSEESERLLETELGQLQLHILKGLFDEEAKSISTMTTNTSAESQFLLGKEEGIKKALEILNILIDRTNILYTKKWPSSLEIAPKESK